MDAKQAREIFDAAIANATDADQIARTELLREFFCNPDFRKALADYSFAVTQ